MQSLLQTYLFLIIAGIVGKGGIVWGTRRVGRGVGTPDGRGSRGVKVVGVVGLSLRACSPDHFRFKVPTQKTRIPDTRVPRIYTG